MKNHFSNGGLAEKIIILSRIIEHSANHNVLEKLGISLAGYEIMHILNYHPLAEPSMLAKFLGSGKSNVTQRINILIKNKLVTKTKATNGDGRKALIKLTSEGVSLLKKAEHGLKAEALKIENLIGKNHIKAHSTFLEKIFNALISTHKNCCPKKILSTMKKNIIIPLLLISVAITLTGCGKKEEAKIEKQPIAVKAQTAEDSRQIETRLEYAAMVYPEEEALIVAKVGGTATQVKFKLGETVKAGDVLVKIDDASGKNQANNYSFNASQVQQAQLAVQQAYSALMMAQTNYQTSPESSPSVASENYRAAQIAYETAQLATQQAKINLNNSQKQINLSGSDTSTNSASTADTAANTCDSIISGLNDSLGLDVNPPFLAYSTNLGVLDTSVIYQAKNIYSLAKAANEVYKLNAFTDTTTRVKAAIDLASKTKNATDSAKKILDKTPSLNGMSLSTLIGIINGYQTQANGALAQANGAKQSLENTNLGNDSSLSLLQKAYELAQKQEAAALQNLNTLKTGQTNQFDIAELQYKNAVAGLQGLYDSHLAISPISGTITKKEVDNGTTISPGQTLASVSRTDQVKIQFFVDEDSLKYLSAGQAVEIIGNDGQTITGKIFNLTPQADQISKKFLVEVKPDNTATAKLTAGTVVNVAISFKKTTTAENTVILPLSAIEISQNNNYIFTINNGVAQKTPVQIIKVDGETAQVEFKGDKKTLIIIEGNKLVNEGDSVKN
jgi:RND family efflux transporter MFP subunit